MVIQFWKHENVVHYGIMFSKLPLKLLSKIKILWLQLKSSIVSIRPSENLGVVVFHSRFFVGFKIFQKYLTVSMSYWMLNQLAKFRVKIRIQKLTGVTFFAITYLLVNSYCRKSIQHKILLQKNPKVVILVILEWLDVQLN